MTRPLVPRAGDRTTQALERGVERVAQAQESAFGAGGRALKEQTLAGSSNTTIQHGLRRQPQGYIITRQDVSTVPAWVSWDKDTLVLNNPNVSDIEVDLWVY